MLLSLVSELSELLADAEDSVSLEDDAITINKNNLIRVLFFLKRAKGFKQLSDLFAVDFNLQKNRFAIFYCLLNYEENIRVVLKTSLNDAESITSIVDVYKNADFYEREVFDMFGIRFFNHSDLRRILTNNASVPLRKS